MEINREIKNITSAFVLEDNLTECVPYGSGHINDTYRLTYDTGKHYILQKMNRSIFTKPVELMENVSGVTAWLKKKILENGVVVEEAPSQEFAKIRSESGFCNCNIADF